MKSRKHLLEKLKTSPTFRKNKRLFLVKGAELLKRHNLSHYKLGICDSKTCYAWCEFNTFIIKFSTYFLASQRTKPKHIIETLLHEIAHGIVHKHSYKKYKPHGKEWKSIYNQYLENYDIKHEHVHFMNKTNSKYVLKCDLGCSHIEQRLCPRYLLYCKPHKLPLTIRQNY